MAFAHADPVAVWIRATLRAPIASIGGAGVGLSIAALYVLALPSCRPADHWSTERPLLAFVVAALPPIAGLWLDWARLSRAGSRAKACSLALLLAALAGAIACGLVAHPFGLLACVAAWGALAAVIALAGAAIERRMARGSIAVLEGRVRARDAERVIVELDPGLAALDRRHPDLSDARVGAPLAFAALGAGRGGDPFRTERRWIVRALLIAAPSRALVRSRWRARILAWVAYGLGLGIASAGLAAALAHGAC